MEERKQPLIRKPENPAPKPDVDDLIFQNEHWLTSDR